MRAFTLALLAATIACRAQNGVSAAQQEQQRTAQAGDTVSLAIGDRVSFPQTGAAVRFDSVLADSRCPKDVVCVWAGSVRARLSISDSSRVARTVDLESGTEPRSTTVGAYEIRLLPEIAPIKGDTGRYVIRLAIGSG